MDKVVIVIRLSVIRLPAKLPVTGFDILPF